MFKKRGLFGLFIVLLLVGSLLISTVLAVSEDQVAQTSLDGFSPKLGLALFMDDDKCEYDSKIAEGWVTSDDWDPAGSCDADDFTLMTGKEGCDVLIVNEDTWTADSCGQYRIPEGYILASYLDLGSIMSPVTKDISEEGNDEEVKCFTKVKWNSWNDNSALCAYNSKDHRYNWIECNKNTIGKSILSKDKQKIFVCGYLNKNKLQFKWYESGNIPEELDLDGDGVPNTMDCHPENPNARPDFACQYEYEEKDGKLTNIIKIDPDTKEKSTICDVKKISEICGDGLDNDCDGLTDNCESNKEVCLNSDSSWIDSSCCGDSPSDNGQVNGKYLCLNKEKTDGIDTSKDYWKHITSGSSNPVNCGNWCWVNAEMADFNIFTVNNEYKSDYETIIPPSNSGQSSDSYSPIPTKVVYVEEIPKDYISNGEQWLTCNQEGKLDSTNLMFETDIVDTNRFYCYPFDVTSKSYSDKNFITSLKQVYSLADCRNPSSQTDNGKKSRSAGEGLFAFSVKNQNEESSQKVIEIKDSYPQYPQGISFAGYDNLEFSVRFRKIDDSPAGITVNIYSENKEKVKTLLLSKDALSYSQNTPLLIADRWINIKMPLSADPPNSLIDVDYITVDSLKTKHPIEVRNVHLSKKDQDFLCSGDKSAQKGVSSWLAKGADHWIDEGVTGENICKELYSTSPSTTSSKESSKKESASPSAWLGGKDLPEERRCCGNQPNEYYAGYSENNNGCWNSEPVSPGQTMTNIEFSLSSTGATSNDYSYACFSDECTYPLPLLGQPPYTLTAKNNGLYELWFVGEGGKEQLLSSPSATISEQGNLRAKKVSPSVLFINDNKEQKFYSCNYKFDKIPDLLTVNYCTVKGDRYCSPAEVSITGINNKIIASSWSSQPLEQVGYDLKGITYPTSTDQLSSLSTLPLKAADPKVKEAKNRNFTTASLPGRNLLSNPDFSTPYYWELLDQGILTKFIPAENKVQLKPSQVLRSVRIAIPSKEDFSFTHSGDCSFKVFLIDQEGKISSKESSPQQVLSFNSASSQLLWVEFFPLKESSCAVEKPLLQIREGKEPAYIELSTDKVWRSGLACCPQDYCWNGYACVEPMKGNSLLAEYVPSGKGYQAYRCLSGKWSNQAIKKDWNNDQFGFCSAKDECFVMPSSSAQSAADSVGSASSASSGQKFASCLSSGQYLFDHYCEAGNWTSRTKYLAETMLKAVEGDEYVLYCAEPFSAMVSASDLVKQMISGEVKKVSSEKSSPLKSNQTEISLSSCFSEKHPLISDEENTCINNLCVLKFRSGGQWLTAFAASLNKPANATGSFLTSLQVDPSKLKSSCPAGNGFVKCNLAGISGELWYNQNLNSIIFSSPGLSYGTVAPTTWEKIKSFFSGWFKGETSSASNAVLLESRNLREVYFLNKDGKKIKGIKEVSGKDSESLIIEYSGFQSPLCDYASDLRINDANLKSELLEKESQVFGLSCEEKEDLTTISAVEGTDFLWPQLTAKLRVGDFNSEE
jgi:hypothetical protein